MKKKILKYITKYEKYFREEKFNKIQRFTGSINNLEGIGFESERQHSLFYTLPDALVLNNYMKTNLSNISLGKYKITHLYGLREMVLFNNSHGYVYYKFDDFFLGLYEHENDVYDVTVYYKNTFELLPELFEVLKKYNITVYDELNKTCKFIVYTNNNYQLIDGEDYTNKHETINFEYYNDDFREVYDTMINELTNSKIGLYFLYGIPGSGKTTIIKHLLNKIPRKFVFIPTNIMADISNPALLSFIQKECKGAVLILEDGEEILKDRLNSRTNTVSTLLNMTDGILGDLLNISIICTYNNNISIDQALLRKGRAKVKYEFKPLSIEKATAINSNITKPMSLADCLFYESTGFITKKNFGLNT